MITKLAFIRLTIRNQIFNKVGSGKSRSEQSTSRIEAASTKLIVIYEDDYSKLACHTITVTQISGLIIIIKFARHYQP